MHNRSLNTALVRHIAGGSAGGPLVTDRTFYFGAAEVQRQTTPITLRFARPVSGLAVPELLVGLRRNHVLC